MLFDLKIGELKHQDIGQMQMYVHYYDRKMKLPEENPTIGIILCKDKNNAVVEMTLPEDNSQIFASKYETVLPSKEDLQKLLEEGDYSREAKRRRHGHGSISAAFWLGMVSIYLAYSFITGDWRRSWMVWPVAGVLYAALAAALSGRRGR